MRSLLCLAALAALTAPSQAQDRPFMGQCLLRVQDRTYLNGRCPISMSADGSFAIGIAAERYRPTYFAYVFPDGDTADAHWNEDPGASRAHTSLGTLTNRRDGCWSNASALVCAWRR